MGKKVKVTPKEDGAVISVDGYNIIVTVKPIEEIVPRINVESVRARLGEYIEELEVSEEAEEIIIMPKGFLGRDRFASIANLIEEMGGRYISAGKESRFIISKR